MEWVCGLCHKTGLTWNPSFHAYERVIFLFCNFFLKKKIKLHGWNMAGKNRRFIAIFWKNQRFIAILSAKYHRFYRLIADFFQSFSVFSARAFTRRFFADFSVLHRYFADISAILPIFGRFFRRSIIGADYRFGAARYPIFLRNIGDIFRFFNPWSYVRRIDEYSFKSLISPLSTEALHLTVPSLAV